MREVLDEFKRRLREEKCDPGRKAFLEREIQRIEKELKDAGDLRRSGERDV
jgi:hypothetical protein